MKYNNLSAKEAFDLANRGLWVSNSGYTWRNSGGYGYYWAFGNYPNCVRVTKEFTLENFASVNGNWRLLVPQTVTRPVSCRKQ